MTAANELLPGDRICLSTPTCYNASTAVVEISRPLWNVIRLLLSDGNTLEIDPAARLDVLPRRRPLTDA